MNLQWLVEAVKLGIILIAVHFIADLFFQAGMQKILKRCGIQYSKDYWRMLIPHLLLYSLTFLPIFLWLEINLWWLAWLFASHLLIDGFKYRIVLSLYGWVSKLVTQKNSGSLWWFLGLDQLLRYHYKWANRLVDNKLSSLGVMMVDQFLHFVPLGVIVLATML